MGIFNIYSKPYGISTMVTNFKFRKSNPERGLSVEAGPDEAMGAQKAVYIYIRYTVYAT